MNPTVVQPHPHGATVNTDIPLFPRHKFFKRRKPKATQVHNHQIRVAGANFQKKTDTSKIFRLFQEGVDVIFATGVTSKLQLPFVYSFPSSPAFHYIHEGPNHGEKHGSAVFISPRLAPYAVKQPHPDDEGLMCHVKLHPPGLPPIKLVSTYAPPKDHTRRKKIETFLSKLLSINNNTATNSTLSTRVENANTLLCGGDFNAILQDNLDSHNLKTKNEWKWLTEQILPTGNSPRTLIDVFRSLNPTLRQFTRYSSGAHTSETRLDLILCNPKALETLTPQESTIKSFDKTSDHHPVLASFDTSSLPQTKEPQPPPLIYRYLNQDEKKAFSDRLGEWDHWASQVLPIFGDLPHDTKVKIVNKVLLALSDTYHSITSSHTHKPSKLDMKVDSLRNHIPPATSTDFNAKMSELQIMIDELHLEKDTKKLHRNLVRGVKLKRTLNEALAPSNSAPAALYTSSSKDSTTDNTEHMIQIMANSLRELGGNVDFQPTPQILSNFPHHTPTEPALNHFTIPHITWSQFKNKINRAQPSKAGGRDQCNLYVISLAPHHLCELLYHACNYFLFNPLPTEWSQADIFLLFKKGDNKDPSNYRPISPLNAIYKIISSHINESLSRVLHKHKPINTIQIRGMENRRTSDHLYRVTQHMFHHPGGYNMYIDFNKAFNSVPREAPWQILQHMGFSSEVISVLQNLYIKPQDFPRILGFTKHSYTLDRGVRQGCPLSPLLFVLYINVVLHRLDSLLAEFQTPATKAWAFIDDILVRLASPQQAQTIFEFFESPVRQLGLEMNVGKTEIHAMDPSPNFSLQTNTGTTLSTYDKRGNPHTSYKYLGSWIFTTKQAPQLYNFLRNKITGFFDRLTPLSLTFSENILLVNTLLIPIISYRSLTHRLSIEVVQLLQKQIWTELCHATPLCKQISPKDIYSPRKRGGLGLRSLELSVHKTTFYSGLRHLNQESPPDIHDPLRHDLLSETPNLFFDSFVEPCAFLKVLPHGFGPPWNQKLCQQLVICEKLKALLTTDAGVTDYFPAEVVAENDQFATIAFSDATLDLEDSDDFIMHDPDSPPNDFFSHVFLCPPLYQPPLIADNAPAPPVGLADPEIHHDGILFKHPFHLPENTEADLLFWNCMSAAEANKESHQSHVYLDGSAKGPHRGSAILFFHKNQPLLNYALAIPSPYQSSADAEFWALLSFMRRHDWSSTGTVLIFPAILR